MRHGDAERNACAFTPVIRADKNQEQLPFVGEKMYAFELSVGDENNIIVAYVKMLGLAHVAESVSRLSKGAHELHLRIKNLYARVHRIGYKEPAILGSGDARREVEPSRAVADASDALQQSAGCRRIHMDFMSLDVGHK
jgi:hypothetical protein